MVDGIFFKFGMWLPLSGGHLHREIGAVWIRPRIRHHGATYLHKNSQAVKKGVAHAKKTA